VDICCVIPAYNEEKTIELIAQGVKKYIKTVIVVDNLCTDKTREIAINNGTIIVSQYEKRGYGISQYSGQFFAICRGFNYILQIDADGQHDCSDIPRLIEKMQSDNYDIVLGSRFLLGIPDNLNWHRKLGIIVLSKIISLIARQKVTDVTSGFKIYKVSSLKQLHKPSDINPAIEQMTEIAKKKMKIGEVPIKSIAREYGSSHLDIQKTLLYPLRALWHIIKVLIFY
jgi:glycosyltransferase involved in cell wall biosynthesis